MAYKTGIANGYRDMLFMMHKFLTSANMISDPTYDAGLEPAIGYGWVSAEWADDSSGIVLDAWTIEFDSGGSSFTVTGADSSHGLQTNTGTVGTPYVSDNGEIGFTLVAGTEDWSSGDQIVLTVTAGVGATAKWAANRYNMVYDGSITPYGLNVGNGSIGNPNYDMYAPMETWTITFVEDSGGDYWTVVGSVSGSSEDSASTWPTCETGVAYDNDLVSFTISDADSGTPWTDGDYITFDIPNWHEIMWEAPGNAGTEEIYMGLKTYNSNELDPQPAEPVYQWMMNGYTGYNPSADFGSQPGAIDYPANDSIPRCVFLEGPMEYWLVANGRRVMMFYDVDGVYECMHMGFILSYGNPVENPYPLAIGGSTTYSIHDYTSENEYHRAFFDGPIYDTKTGGFPYYTNLRIWDGSNWNLIGGVECHYDIRSTVYGGSHVGANWPYHSSGKNASESLYYSYYHWNQITKNSDDSYCLFPIIPMVALPDRIIFGEIEGLYAVPGLNLTRKDTTTIDSVDYILFGNIFRNNQNSWCAFRLE